MLMTENIVSWQNHNPFPPRIMIDIKNEHVQRWAVVIGDLGEGTSIDFEEPFVIR